MKELLKIIAEKDKAALMELRHLPGLKLARQEGELWLRGIFVTEEEDAATRKLPALQTYSIGPDELLFPPGALTPVARLQTMAWQPLREALTLHMPVAAFPGQLGEKFQVRLVPGKEEKELYATVLPLELWLIEASQLPETRLRHLKFAVAADRRVLVLNASLVNLQGEQYWRQGNNLAPMGLDFDPPLLNEVLADALNTEGEYLLLFRAEGDYEAIPLKKFTTGTRAAILAYTEQRGEKPNL